MFCLPALHGLSLTSTIDLSLQIWNTVQLDAMIKDPDSGYGVGAGFIVQDAEMLSPRPDPGPDETCRTSGGTAPEGSMCAFPFSYKGETYRSCTTRRHYRLWCSTDRVYSGNWGNCGSSCRRKSAKGFGKAQAKEGGLTKEAIISLAITQVPAVILAVLNIVDAFHNKKRLRGIFKAFLLTFIPFFVLELIDPIWKILPWGKAITKICHVPYLAQDNEYQQSLAIDLIRVFFGSALQLTFQAVLLMGYTPRRSIESAQIVSIVSSLFSILFYTAQSISFVKTEEEKGQNKKQFYKKVIETITRYFIFKLKMFKAFLKFFPLLLTSAVANFGTIILTVLINEWIALAFIIVAFLVNFLIFLIPLSWIKKIMNILGLINKLPPSREGAGKPNQHAVFMTWSNMFLMSKSLEEPSFQRTGQIILIQGSRFLLNLGILLGIMGYLSTTNKMLSGTIYTYLAMACFNIVAIFVYYNMKENGGLRQFGRNTVVKSSDLDGIWATPDRRDKVRNHLNQI